VVGIALTAVFTTLASAGTASAEARAATSTLTATVGAVDVAAPLSGSRRVEIPVTLNEPAPATVSLRYRVVAGTARAGYDFKSKTGLLTFDRHSVNASIAVTVLADSTTPTSTCWYQAATACRTFSVMLTVDSGSVEVASAPSADWILFNAPGGQGVSVGDAVVANGASGADRVVRVPVTLAEPARAAIAVAYKLVAGSALATDSFLAAHGTIRFHRAETTLYVVVSIVPGKGFQPFEVLYVELSHPSGASVARAEGTVVIATGAAGIPDPISPSYAGASLTQIVSAKTKTGDSYTIAVNGASTTMTGNAPVLSSNDRMAFWPTAESPVADQESCATWASQTPAQSSGIYTQEGLALRFATQDGVTRGLTVTKGVWANANYVLNVHLWNTTWSTPFLLLKSFDLSSYLVTGGDTTQLPWDVCARVVGTTLQFEVWFAGQTPPAWGNTAQGGAVTLPAGWDYAGQAGWYIGHLATDASATYTNMVVEAPQHAPAL
jgi:hypothetical protein